MVLKTYIDKLNTIQSGSRINTGKNPVSELYYGVNGDGDWVFSRMLLHFDTTKLEKQYQDGMLGDLSKVKHTIKLVNTGNFHDGLLSNPDFMGKTRTSSFDLEVYPISESWDEGVGYDYQEFRESVTRETPSNWFVAQGNTEWTSQGATSINPDYNWVIHFEDGNENLVLGDDEGTSTFSDWVNGVIKGEIANNGLLIKFSSVHEDEPTEISTELAEAGVQYVGFFTNSTQTFYEPCLESKYESYIRDDRRNFHLDKINRLYLYVNANGEPMNLGNDMVNDAPQVTINFGETPLIKTAKQEKKGVYYVEVDLTNENVTLPYCTDVWSNLKMNFGTTEAPDIRIMNDVHMGFEVDKKNDFFTLGLGMETKKKDYKMVISGLRHGETIKRGDVRRVYTNAIVPYKVDQKVLLDNITYRLYVKEGNMEHTVIDYEPVERSYKDNYLILDTDSLLPNVYYLDIKMELNQEIKTTKEIISFQVIE